MYAVLKVTVYMNHEKEYSKRTRLNTLKVKKGENKETGEMPGQRFFVGRGRVIQGAGVFDLAL